MIQMSLLRFEKMILSLFQLQISKKRSSLTLLHFPIQLRDYQIQAYAQSHHKYNTFD